MANNNSDSRRAALRQQQELEAREARTRKNIMIGLGVVGAIILLAVAFLLYRSLADRNPGTVTENQLRPPNATETYGIADHIEGAEPKADAPHLTVWQDYQCNHCAERKLVYGDAVKQLVEQGEITVSYQTAHFMDKGNNDGSFRSAVAAAAADEVGHFDAYNQALFEYRLTEDFYNAGYSEEVLREQLPKKVGIEGDELKRFQELYDQRAFTDFVNSANDQFTKSQWRATPVYEVGGKELQFGDAQGNTLIQPTAEDLLRAIKEAA